jgi:hypothetical protein
MNESRRSDAGRADAISELLISAGRRDQAPAEVRRRNLAALGLGAAAAGTAAVATAGSTVARATAGKSAVLAGSLKWLAAALLLAGAGGGGLLFLRRADRAEVAPGGPSAPAAPSVSAPAAPVAPSVPATPAARQTATPAVGATAQRSRLAEEVALIDSARAALTRRDGAAALRLLGTYATRFSSGTLALEAAVLEVDALAALGRLDDARGRAARVLVSFPEGPHSSRLRERWGK